MPIDPRWSELGGSDWLALARAWLEEWRRGVPLEDTEAGRSLVLMNFAATPDAQWEFIGAAVSLAADDEDRRHVAAGPIEHLLGTPGPLVSDRVERFAAEEPRFARALTGTWPVADGGVRARVEEACARVRDPLAPASG